jgi:FMN phosphatase YigB (HAD superfamily)
MNNKNEPLKIVVFDLDETLGCFLQFGIFWDTLLSYIKLVNKGKMDQNQDIFNEFLDLYPEFLRPDILTILDYLKKQKKNGICDTVMIFTNNQGPPSWAEHIKKYLENKVQYKLFDKVIGAYEVDGIIREKCRTSHEKSYHDLLRCSNIHRPVKVCFVDDLLHKGMINPNVDYIKINPYVFHLHPLIIVERALKSQFVKKYVENDTFFKNFMMVKMSKFRFHFNKKTKIEYDIDIIATKKTFHYIENFLSR